MATATAGYEWTSSTKTLFNIATGSLLADGGATVTARCAWSSALAPFDIQLEVKGIGDASSSGYVNIKYKWINLTGSASSTMVVGGDALNWRLAGSLKMSSASSRVVLTVPVSVEGTHLAARMENSSGGSVSAISLIAIARHVKAG